MKVHPIVILTMLPWLIVAFIVYISVAFASGSHHDTHVTNVYPTETFYVTEQVNTSTFATSTVINENTSGAALGIATGQLNFDFATDAFQVSAGLGNYQDDKAGVIGVAKRFGGILINGSYGKESNSEGYGIGATMRFK